MSPILRLVNAKLAKRDIIPLSLWEITSDLAAVVMEPSRVANCSIRARREGGGHGESLFYYLGRRFAMPVSLAALIFGGMGTLHAAHPISGFEDCPVVADSELDQMRGGFETSAGGLPLSFTFGIERQTYLNGQLVSTTTIAIPTFSSANTQGVAAAVFNPIVIQNGPGNEFSLQGIPNLPTSAMTVIQNSLDNQVIGNATVINASITSRDFLRSLAVQSSLNQMVFRSVH